MFNVTIGVPAYNEDANIGILLETLLTQNTDNFLLKNIIVVSDCSNDRTDQIVSGFKSSNVKLVRNNSRQGQAFSQNRIIEDCTSDALILLNADIGIDDKNFIKKMVTPILNENIDLTSSRLRAVSPTGIVEKAVWVGFEMRSFMFERFRNGQSVHTCWGAARAFSKKLYKKFRFKNSVGEDAYSYFYCKKNGYKYRHLPRAECLFKLSDNISDHKKQSLRNIKGRELLITEFGADIVKDEYPGPSVFFGMPSQLILLAMLKMLFKYPFSLFVYLVITVATLVNSLFIRKISDKWSMSTSSKLLIRDRK